MRGKNKFKYTYDNYEFGNIVNTIKEDPFLSLELIDEYLSIYPTDYAMYSFKATNLIMLRRFDEAKEAIEYAIVMANNDVKYKSLEGRLEIFNEYVIFSKLQLLMYSEEYESAYKYAMDNYNIIVNTDNPFNNKLVFTFLKKQMGIEMPRQGEDRYLYNQIVDYQKSDFLEHIKKHLADCTEESMDEKFVFVPDFPLDKVLDELYKLIPSDNGLCTALFDNMYVFKYDECGRVDNKLTNFFIVATFHNTNEFITMCPVSISDNYPYIDLNYLKPKKEMVRARRLSQIEKFNNKYNTK